MSLGRAFIVTRKSDGAKYTLYACDWQDAADEMAEDYGPDWTSLYQLEDGF